MTMQFLVDWDNDGNFGNAHSDVSDDVVSANWFLGARTIYQSVCDEPTIDLTLSNLDGKYSPENAGSPIAGKVRPYVRMRVRETVTNTQLWNGYLDMTAIAWQPMGAVTGRHEIVLQGVGARQLLGRLDLLLPQMTNKRADEIILSVLLQAGIYLPTVEIWALGNPVWSVLGETTVLGTTSDWADLDEGISNIPYYGGGMVNAWDVIAEFANTERGRFYIDRDGKYVFRNRHHPYYSDVTDFVLEDTNNRLNELDYRYGDILTNSVTVSSRPRQVNIREELWRIEQSLTVAAGQTVTLEARLRRPNGQFASASALDVDVVFSSGTANVYVSPRGGAASVTITNNTINNAVVDALVLFGTPSYDQNELRATVEDADSIKSYGRRAKTFDVGGVDNWQEVSDIAHMEILRLPMRGRVDSFSMIAQADGVQNAGILARQIGDFVEVDAPTVYHEGRYVITGEQHSWQMGDGGGVHEATFFCEPVVQMGFILDKIGWMELDGEKTVLIY